MIPLILTGSARMTRSVYPMLMTRHQEGSPLTWDSPTGDAMYDDGNGVLSKEIDFAISVLVML